MISTTETSNCRPYSRLEYYLEFFRGNGEETSLRSWSLEIFCNIPTCNGGDICWVEGMHTVLYRLDGRLLQQTTVLYCTVLFNGRIPSKKEAKMRGMSRRETRFVSLQVVNCQMSHHFSCYYHFNITRVD